MIRSLQILRGLAAIGILAVHIQLTEAKKLQFHAAPRFFHFGYASIDLFFVISGFIMVFIQPTPINSAISHIKFLINRFTRVFPPYWLAMLPLIPVWLKWPLLFNNYNGNHVDIVRSFLLLPQNYTPLLGVGWTLIHELYFYLCVSFVLHFALRGRVVAGVIWIATVFIVFCLFGGTHFGENRYLQLIFSPFSLTFLLGYFIGLAQAHIRQWPISIGFILLITGVVSIVFGYGHLPDLYIYPDNNFLSRFFIFGIPCGLIVLSALVFEVHLTKTILRLQYFGDISYTLYLLHAPIVVAFYMGFSKLPWKGWLPSWIAIIACATICLLVAVAFHEKLEIKTTRWLRTWIEKHLVKYEKKSALNPAI